MWYAGQRVICTNDHFSGAIWDWTSTVPREGEVYTIAAMESAHAHPEFPPAGIAR